MTHGTFADITITSEWLTVLVFIAGVAVSLVAYFVKHNSRMAVVETKIDAMADSLGKRNGHGDVNVAIGKVLDKLEILDNRSSTMHDRIKALEDAAA